MMQTIQDVAVVACGQLAISYADGHRLMIDLAAWIEQGGVFAALSDSEFFAQVEIGERGRFLVWPGDLELCADALRRELPGEPIV